MKQTNFMKIYIFPMLFISPLMTISCNSWFSIWIMMELNLMMFIPLIINFNKYYKELAFKYFIIQTISSSFLIIMSNSMIINFNNSFFWIKLIMNFSLLMKIGFPPFQFWFINMMNNMIWLNCMLLSTWQKIIPMMIMMYIFMKIIFILIIYSSILSAIMGLNQQSIRILMSYSSINHMSWMILNLMISELMWKLYFIMYMIINLSIMMILNLFNIYYINQMFILNKFKKFKFFILMNLLSLCGLPPLFGFNMKWLSIYFFSLNKFYIINLIMIMMSIMTIIFYSRMMISFLLMHSIKNKMMLSNKFINKNYIYYINLLNFFNLWFMSIYLF